MKTVLVVDDKEMMRDSVGSTLERAGFAVRTADGGEAALSAVAARRPDVIVSDLKMPGMTGIELLGRVREIDDELPMLLMTAFGTVETAVEAMKLGAFDYVTKPFKGDELVIAIKRACRHASLVKENAVLRAAAGAASADQGERARRGVARLVGSSSAMRRVREQVAAVADSQGTVMVVGESGSGKEMVARAVHEASSRSAGPFLAVNCAALSESLLESELFGHEKGAFTGADTLRKGRFELADGGTLLLDEVSEIPPSLQAKLLRVLQERSFERVGSSTTIGVDVRVVATSNRDLPRSVGRGEFRQDLFFRLNVLPIHLPPLRERAGDAVELAELFVRSISEREGSSAPELTAGVREALGRYPWPGNVRELQNICERAVVLGKASGGGPIDGALIEPWLGMPGADEPEQAAGSPFGGMGDRPASEPGFGAPADAFGRAGVPVGGHPAPAMHVSPSVTREFIESMGPTARDAATNGLAVAEVTALGASAAGNGHDLRELAQKPVTLEEIEREAIVTTLTRFNGHRQKTAKSLGIGVRTLGLKLKKWKQEQLVPQTL
ncbi:MAG: sigma-54 dependent transcriptional regulator [Planctomycetota bacterium]